MSVSFTTYFGDYLHGLFVTWTSTPSNNAGTTDLVMRMQMNLRSKLHVYGYTGADVPNGSAIYAADAEATWYYEAKEYYNAFVSYDAADPKVTTEVSTFGDSAAAE